MTEPFLSYLEGETAKLSPPQHEGDGFTIDHVVDSHGHLHTGPDPEVLKRIASRNSERLQKLLQQRS